MIGTLENDRIKLKLSAKYDEQVIEEEISNFELEAICNLIQPKNIIPTQMPISQFK